MRAAWNVVTKTARRRFWFFIFPAIAGIAAYVAHVTVMVAQGVRDLDGIEGQLPHRPRHTDAGLI
jgi:hypothetical protein